MCQCTTVAVAVIVRVILGLTTATAVETKTGFKALASQLIFLFQRGANKQLTMTWPGLRQDVQTDWGKASTQ